MIVDTSSGEILERPPRRYWDTRRLARAQHRHQLLVDAVIALSVYAIASTAVIAAIV